MKIDLSGFRILVTGGSRGIGAAIASGLIECGATVAVHYSQSEDSAHQVVEGSTGKSFAIQANLNDVEETEELFSNCIENLGGIDVLINNAGIAIKSSFEKENENWLAEWEETLRVNLTAAAQLSRLAVQQFRRQESGGRIIHISSRAAFRGDTPEYIAYAASKGGMVALSRSIARDFGKENVKSFLIAPGFVRTDMAQDFMDEYGEEYATNDIALPKLTEPADVAGMVVFLASGKADHATGSTIDINAGSYVH